MVVPLHLMVKQSVKKVVTQVKKVASAFKVVTQGDTTLGPGNGALERTVSAGGEKTIVTTGVTDLTTRRVAGAEATPIKSNPDATSSYVTPADICRATYRHAIR